MTTPRLYVVGGRAVTATPQSTIFEADIAADGTLGDFATESLPAPRQNHALAVIDGSMFVVGGIDPNELDGVLVGAMDGGGHFLSWSVFDAWLPTKFGRAGFATLGNKIFIVGGRPNGAAVENDTILRSTTMGTTLSMFEVAATLPFKTSDNGAVIVDNELYAVGGSGMASSQLLRATVDPSTGAVGPLVASNALAVPRDLHCTATGIVGGKKRIYVAGGEDTSANLLGSIEVATVTSGIGPFTLSAVTFAPRRALACAVARESLYVVGGVIDDVSGSPSVDEVTRVELDPDSGLPVATHIERALPAPRGFHQVVVLDIPTP